MNRWDFILFGIGVWVAVMTLVRMMRSRRNQLVGQVKQQIEEHRRLEEERAEAAKANKRA